MFASDETGEAAFSTLPAGEPPFAGSDTVQDGAATATSTYDLSNNSLTITFDHTRQADPLNSYALSGGRVLFSVDADVDYVLSGSYAATDPEGRETFFQGRLFVQEIECCVFHPVAISTQESHATVNESFVLGGTGGDFSNETQGALSGTLTANRVYWFSYRAYIRANPEPSNQPASVATTPSMPPSLISPTQKQCMANAQVA